MYWGNLLLFDWTGLGEFAGNALHALATLIPHILFMIWKCLAWIVDCIEKVFRSLAGLGTNGDMVGYIIQDARVRTIFNNLVGLSTALIVFFTIVKIIQDHYKEKDGGNPYKIIIRTFKGLLMFFFVNAAVVVGLYASGVMFRALDAATGNGSVSIAGLTFQAMAAEANRAYRGADGEGEGLYAERMLNRMTSDGDAKDGKFFLVEFDDDEKKKGTSTNGKSLAERYAAASSGYSWGVVSSDGKTVTPLANYFGVSDSSKEIGEEGYSWNDWAHDNVWGLGGITNGEPSHELNDTNPNHVSGSAGWQADILKMVDFRIAPTIDLSFSPVDIDYINYGMISSGEPVSTPIEIWWRGTLIQRIPINWFFREYQYLGSELDTSKTQAAQKFGFSSKFQVTMQSGSVGASFDINTFDASKFEQLFLTVVGNNLYCDLGINILEQLGPLPTEVKIYMKPFVFTRFLAPIFAKMFETVYEKSLGKMIPVNVDEETGKKTPVATALAVDGKTLDGERAEDAWSTINTQARTVDVKFKRYRVDLGNFKDLYNDLVGDMNRIKQDLIGGYDDALVAAREHIEQAQYLADLAQKQQVWVEYKSKIDDYNEQAAGLLTKLGNLLKVYDVVYPNRNAAETVQNYLNRVGYEKTYDALETEIKNTYVELVKLYNAYVVGQEPVGSFADPRIVPGIYQPIIEFYTDDVTAQSASPLEIKDIMLHNGTFFATKVNMLIDETKQLPYDGTEPIPAAYRLVDWAKYGSRYPDSLNGNLKNVADIYTYANQSAVLANKSLADLQIINMTVETPENPADAVRWDKDGGILYFINQNTTNDFYLHSQSGNVGYTMESNSYWGADGIHWNDDKNAVFYYYEGTTYIPGGHTYNRNPSTASVPVSTATVVRPSSANTNSSFAAGQTQAMSYVDQLTTENPVSDEVNEFTKNIITLRKINPLDSNDRSNDVNVLRDWVKSSGTLSFNTGAKLKMLYDLDNSANPNQRNLNIASRIDDLMASGNWNTRRYLCLTKNGDNSVVTENQQGYQVANGSYVGQFRWSDSTTVDRLYAMNFINFPIGFIMIITAVGVYMQFTFGLIQRAVNLTVLYMMSPVTISFYPFDDGSKFNNNFVKPFYQEAISAFAIIISLNFFAILIQPVRDATAAVVGDGPGGWIMGIFAIVAFISMLPKIRDSISSMLGAKALEGKGIADTFKGMGTALSSPFRDMAGMAAIAKKSIDGGKTLAHGIDKVRSLKNRLYGTSEDRMNKRMENLNERAARGGLVGAMARAERDRLENRKKKKESQLKALADAHQKKEQAIADAQKEFDDVMRNPNATEAQKREAREKLNKAKNADGTAGLSLAQKKIFYKQEAAAKSKAKELVKRADFKDENGKVNKDKYNAALTAATSGLLQDETFNRQTNGVHVAKKVKRQANLANSGFAAAMKGIGVNIATSGVGELFRAHFGVNGTLAENKDSLLGAWARARNAEKNAEEIKAAGNKYRDEQIKKWADPLQQVVDACVEAQKPLEEAQRAEDRAVASLAGKDKLKDKKVEEKYHAKRIADIIAEGKAKDEKEAEKKYQEELKEKCKTGWEDYITDQGFKNYVMKQGKNISNRESYVELLTTKYTQEIQAEAENKGETITEADAIEKARIKAETEVMNGEVDFDSILNYSLGDKTLGSLNEQQCLDTLIAQIMALSPSLSKVEARKNALDAIGKAKMQARKDAFNDPSNSEIMAQVYDAWREDIKSRYPAASESDIQGMLDDKWESFMSTRDADFAAEFNRLGLKKKMPPIDMNKIYNSKELFESAYYYERLSDAANTIIGDEKSPIKQKYEKDFEEYSIQKQVEKNRAQYIQEQYEKAGGDEQLTKDITDGHIGLSAEFKLNEDDLNKAKAEFAKLCKMGEAELNQNIHAITQDRDSKLDSVKDIAKALGKEDDADLIKYLKTCMSHIDNNTKLDEIAKQICNDNKDLDNDEVLNSLKANLNTINEIAKKNTELQIRDDAKTVIDKRKEAQGKVANKIGNFVNEADKAAVMERYSEVYDVDINSTNVNSFGYKKRQILEQFSGDESNPECIAQINRLKESMENSFTQYMKQFVQRNEAELRQQKFAKAHRDEMDSIFKRPIITSLQENRERYLDEVPPDALRLMVSDSHRQELIRKGNYAGAGEEFIALINAFRKHDVAAVRESKFDQSTIDAVQKWVENGNDYYINSIKAISQFDMEHMGSMLTEMKGSSIANAQTVLAHLTSMVENKLATQKMDTMIQSLGSQESNARARVDEMINSMQGTFGGEQWKELAGSIRNLNGKICANTTEMAEALQETLRALNSSNDNIHNEIVEKNRAALAKWKADHAHDANFNSMVGDIDRLESSFGQAITANDCSDRVNATFAAKMKLLAGQRENEKKIKELMSTGKGS